MLSKNVYQSLPYLYMGVGLLCLLVIESPLVFFSSALLIIAGGLVLWLRYKNTAQLVSYRHARYAINDEYYEMFSEASPQGYDHERRLDDDRVFPLLDDNGMMVAFDRRRSKHR